MTIDHPHIRQSHSCPLCGEAKNTGLVVCWECFGTYAMRHGNAEIESELDGELRSVAENDFAPSYRDDDGYDRPMPRPKFTGRSI